MTIGLRSSVVGLGAVAGLVAAGSLIFLLWPRQDVAPRTVPPAFRDVPPSTAPALAPAVDDASEASIGGVRCQAGEAGPVHEHALLRLDVDGQPRSVPEGIGIVPPRAYVSTPVGMVVAGGSCFYWLHTHATDGVIHVEAPADRRFTLGDFFDVWGEPLGRDRVGPAIGAVRVLVDGRPFTGDPRTIRLSNGTAIALSVTAAAGPQPG